MLRTVNFVMRRGTSKMINIISEKNLKNSEIISKEKVEQFLIKEKPKVYEVIRIINSKPLFLQEHVNRFNKSINLLGLSRKFEHNVILELIEKIIENNNISNKNIRMTYFYDEEDILLLYFIKSPYPGKEIYTQGIKTVTVKKTRKNPNAKIYEKKLRANIDDILDNNNAFEAILINNNNIINEGSRSNIFFVKKDKVVTSKDKSVLLGVTRQKVLKLCSENNIEIEKRNIHVDEIKQFEGAFITGTSINILPIRQIDQHRYNFAGNELIKKISKLYDIEVKIQIE